LEALSYGHGWTTLLTDIMMVNDAMVMVMAAGGRLVFDGVVIGDW